MNKNFLIFDLLIWGTVGVVFTILFNVFFIFIIPIQLGMIIVFIIAFILGFLKTKITLSIIQGLLVSFFMGLFLVDIFFLGDLGGYIMRNLIGDLFIRLLPASNNTLIFYLYFILLITLNGFLGGLLAKKLQKQSR